MTLLVGGSTFLTAGASPAAAHHGGEPLFIAEEWNVCVGPLPRFSDGPIPEAIAAGRWATSVFAAVPGMDITYHSTCEDDDGLLNLDMNVLVMHGNHPDEPWLVDTPCAFLSDPYDEDSPCGTTFVILNVPAIEATANPWLAWRKAACEGFGRIAGLGPRALLTSCMKPGASPWILPFLDAHDRAEVSRIYSR